MTKPHPDELKLLFKLLQENATLGEVSHFLKGRGLHYSAGSWEYLFENRLATAVESGELAREDLIDLLRLTEEHGKQHVFLYKCSRAEALALQAEPRVNTLLATMGLAAVKTKPRILDQPRHLTVTDVRWEGQPGEQSFVFKVVKQRKHTVFVGEFEEDGFLVRRYRQTTVRAVNLFKLRPDGMLELRIFSHTNSSDYRSDVQEMWQVVGEILPRAQFTEFSIADAKTTLWAQRSAIKDIVSFSDSRLTNRKGTRLLAATATEEVSLYDDAGATESIEVFLRHDAHCESLNIWWLAPRTKNGDVDSTKVPSRDTHMMLPRSLNEFALPSKCAGDDYEYAFSQLRKFNVKATGRA
jgi:hypothetical protein